MRFNLSQAAFSPLHKQSVGGLLSTSLVAKWTFLCVAPLAFALTNTGALTRGWGPRQGCWSSVWYGLLRVWSPSTHTAVAEQTNLSMVSVVFVLYTVYICMHQQTYTLSLLLVFFFFAWLFKPSIHSHYHSLMSLWVISTWLSVACRRTPDALPSYSSIYLSITFLSPFLFLFFFRFFASLLFVEEDHQLKIVFWCHLPKPVKTRYIQKR